MNYGRFVGVCSGGVVCSDGTSRDFALVSTSRSAHLPQTWSYAADREMAHPELDAAAALPLSAMRRRSTTTNRLERAPVSERSPTELAASAKKKRSRAFYGLSIGAYVCVHGEGFGTVVAMEEGRYPSEDRVTVEIPRRERHRPSGRVIEWTETFTRHPTNVSLNRR